MTADEALAAIESADRGEWDGQYACMYGGVTTALKAEVLRLREELATSKTLAVAAHAGRIAAEAALARVEELPAECIIRAAEWRGKGDYGSGREDEAAWCALMLEAALKDGSHPR